MAGKPTITAIKGDPLWGIEPSVSKHSYNEKA